MVRTRVLLCATGSVAAVKVPDLINEFAGHDYDVRVVATEHVKAFVDLQTLPLDVRCYTDQDEWNAWKKIGDDVTHIELRKWADVLVIAPLSANSLAKIAQGLCDNLVTCVARAWPVEQSSRRPVVVAPAMNTYMWDHPLTRKHLTVLQDELSMYIVDPVVKTLACGDTGVGAMASPKEIADAVARLVGRRKIDV
eukprot:Plantae.Rhodophyta-Rhodochaete_pulchella.ctg26982.p3 GENE.Plantae.Rhodophyta-Rhodochaete_pulchella.ctg26982~~Plantae.Rhodophyta-Rhodochaete_pulchella.ctg26982.p3  ORF type:complete len:195 (-),score=33.02 Plantae.Rhodophyta-Rhodochaete_pulchella.ctg26982:828-1412(-)